MTSKRGTPEVLVAALLALLLISYVWYTNSVVHDLPERGTPVEPDLLAGVFRAERHEPDAEYRALQDVIRGVIAQGVPIVVMSPDGRVYATANLPFNPGDSTVAANEGRVKAFIPTLDRANTPFVDASGATVHFGHTKLVQGLRVIPLLQALTGVVLLFAFIYIVRTRSSAAREHLWAGMARESAHQIGTPLSSLSGWIELLEDRAESDPALASAVAHMRGDLDRLDRVAHRFERIGRDAKFESTSVPASVERIASYFRARVPTLANTVQIESIIGQVSPVQGDTVLLEWALEVLVKNAIDALAGRGGTVSLTVQPTKDDGVSIRVADDGPGIPREIRSRVFDPGFSTKKTGWGIGLSLAKRIVEENHGGTLTLLPTDRGATFEIILH